MSGILQLRVESEGPRLSILYDIDGEWRLVVMEWAVQAVPANNHNNKLNTNCTDDYEFIADANTVCMNGGDVAMRSDAAFHALLMIDPRVTPRALRSRSGKRKTCRIWVQRAVCRVGKHGGDTEAQCQSTTTTDLS